MTGLVVVPSYRGEVLEEEFGEISRIWNLDHEVAS
jgi:hypothetical protein